MSTDIHSLKGDLLVLSNELQHAGLYESIFAQAMFGAAKQH